MNHMALLLNVKATYQAAFRLVATQSSCLTPCSHLGPFFFRFSPYLNSTGSPRVMSPALPMWKGTLGDKLHHRHAGLGAPLVDLLALDHPNFRHRLEL